MDEPKLPAVAGPLDGPVRRLSDRLRANAESWAPTQEHTLEAHNLLEEAAKALDRWEAYRMEMADMERRMGKLARNFLECQAWEDAAKCALKADGMQFVRGRMPPSA